MGIVYEQYGSLLRTANIREDADGFSSQYWSTQLNQLPERKFHSKYQGTAVTITPDLRISAPVPTQLHFPSQRDKTFFLPDGVCVSCSDQVSIGNSFILAANWLVDPETVQHLLISYDEGGDFSALTWNYYTFKT